MSFSEQVEARCVDRQAHFQRALLRGKPLRPKGAGWTLGDLVFLTATLNVMLEPLREFSEDEFRTPLSEIFGAAPEGSR